MSEVLNVGIGKCQVETYFDLLNKEKYSFLVKFSKEFKFVSNITFNLSHFECKAWKMNKSTSVFALDTQICKMGQNASQNSVKIGPFDFFLAIK